MPRTNQAPSTPDTGISPPARRTRSARKRRQSASEKVTIQEPAQDVTPQLADVNEDTPLNIPIQSSTSSGASASVSASVSSTPKKKSKSNEKDSGVPLPPPPTTPLPPLPPSGRSTRATRSSRKKTAAAAAAAATTPIPTATPAKAKEDEPKSTSTPKPKPTPASTRKRRQPASTKKKQDAPEPASSSKKKKKSPKKQSTPTSPMASVPAPITSPPKSPIPSKPQMEVQVHRLRNINYIPKGILRLCSTPHQQSNGKGNINENHCPQLAISREGGAVELVSVNEKWRCVGMVEGMKNRPVDSMAWVCDYPKSKKQSDGDGDQPMMMEEDANGNGSDHPKSVYFSKEHQLAAEEQARRRLFGASRDGTIFEIDFKKKKLGGVIGSGGGAVFCLASLAGSGGGGGSANKRNTGCGKLIAAGCEDGSVRIFKATNANVNENEDAPCLELVSTLPSVGGAVSSIAWLPGANGIEGSIIYAGAADGTIRKFECVSALQSARLSGNAPHAISTGAVLLNDDENGMDTDSDTDMASEQLSSLRWKAGLRMTVENLGRRSATKIWTLQALRDGTVISGDSMGNIQFWDGNAGTLLQSFEHNQNNGAVYDVAVSLDQNKVMASGVDSKVVCIERVPSSSSSESRWVLTNQQRSHTHDVHSLAMVYLTDPSGNLGSSGSGKSRELLCTGGLDTKVCSYFVANMKKYRAKTVYKYPTRAPISLSKGPRILSIMRSDKVDFYQLAAATTSALKSLKDMNTGTIPQNEDKTHIGSISLTSNYNLVSMDVSDDGKYLAVSHTAGLMLFSLEIVDTVSEEDGGSTKVIVPTQISVPKDANMACSALKFGSDCLICATTNGTINIVRFPQGSEGVTALLEHAIRPSSTKAYANENFPIIQIAISGDARWFGVARNTTGKGSLQVYSLSQMKLWWTLPCTEAPQSCLNFFGGDGGINPALAVTCNNGVVYLFDVESRRLSDWSEDLGFPAGPNLPRELLSTPDCPQSLAYNKATPSKFVMGGHSWFSSIDLSSPVPLRSKPFPPDHFKARNWSKTYLKEKRRSKSFDANESKAIEDEMSKDETNRNFTICLRYSGIIFQDFLDSNEMVVVEQPWLSIVNTLPDALERQRYGS